MKRFRVAFLILSMLAFVGCEKDDDSSSATISELYAKSSSSEDEEWKRKGDTFFIWEDLQAELDKVKFTNSQDVEEFVLEQFIVVTTGDGKEIYRQLYSFKFIISFEDEFIEILIEAE